MGELGEVINGDEQCPLEGQARLLPFFASTLPRLVLGISRFSARYIAGGNHWPHSGLVVAFVFLCPFLLAASRWPLHSL